MVCGFFGGFFDWKVSDGVVVVDGEVVFFCVDVIWGGIVCGW